MWRLYYGPRDRVGEGGREALGITIPDNARLMRNLLEGIQFVQDHVVHFYHLHVLDWVDLVSALSADPAATSRLAGALSNCSNNSTQYFTGVKNRLNAFVQSGQLVLQRRMNSFQASTSGVAAFRLLIAALGLSQPGQQFVRRPSALRQ